MLEWTTLSYETGESSYGKHAQEVNEYLKGLPTPEAGAWPNLFNPTTGHGCGSKYTFGGPADRNRK